LTKLTINLSLISIKSIPEQVTVLREDTTLKLWWQKVEVGQQENGDIVEGISYALLFYCTITYYVHLRLNNDLSSLLLCCMAKIISKLYLWDYSRFQCDWLLV